MQLTDISEDIAHAIAAFIQSDRDLTSWNQTCRQVHLWTKREAERRKLVLLYSTIEIDERSIQSVTSENLHRHDHGAARYIRDILADLRIGCCVRTLRISDNAVSRKNTLTSRIVPYASLHKTRERENEYIRRTIEAFSFLDSQTKSVWRREALNGHASPLSMVLFTLCRKAKVLDLSRGSNEILTFLAPLLDSLIAQKRSCASKDQTAGISVFPLPPINELRIARITLNQLVRFFEIPSLRKVDGSMISEDDGPVDRKYVAEVGSRCNIEELVLAPSALSADSLAHLVNSLPKLRRLEFATLAGQWSIERPEQSGDFDLAAIEHILDLMRHVKTLTKTLMKSRRLKYDLALVENEMTKRWQVSVAKSDMHEEGDSEWTIPVTTPLVTA